MVSEEREEHRICSLTHYNDFIRFFVTEDGSHALASGIEFDYIQEFIFTSQAFLFHVDNKNVIILYMSAQVGASKEPCTVDKGQFIRGRSIIYEVLIDIELAVDSAACKTSSRVSFRLLLYALHLHSMI